MGDFNIRPIRDDRDRATMYRKAIKDIKAFEQLIAEGKIDKSAAKIGLEQEICIVNTELEPAKGALKLLDDLNLPEYTNELALFNLEVNGQPLLLKGKCFSQAEAELLRLLNAGSNAAKRREMKLLLCGILPTLQYRHLAFSYMTPIKRYKVLSKMLADLRGEKFEIYLQGVDELIMSLESVLFEACNTSFQLHLQIHPDDFREKYNWSQLIAGPVLAACTNSPLLFGRELWSETRIALFKQSLDTRSSKNHLRKKLPRVYFGEGWLEGSPAELWKNELMRFPLLLTSDDFEDPMLRLKENKIPDLRAIRLHNGTTYTWNRLCYGPFGDNPHLRIECRYLPAGPSVVDEIANFAFWVGLMEGQPEDLQGFWRKLDFRTAKDNFIKAARTGLDSVFNWLGQSIPAKDLLLKVLLPIARQGLEKKGIAIEDIERYLGVITERVQKEQTGAQWQIKTFRSLTQKQSRSIALKTMTHQMTEYQQQNIPVSQWTIGQDTDNHPIGLAQHQPLRVEDLMSTDIFIVRAEDSLALVKQIMNWKNIHHIPVENKKGKLIGLITDGIIARSMLSDQDQCLAKDIMITEIITADAKDSVEKAAGLLNEHQLSCLPVTYKDKLVGILTIKDLKELKRLAPAEAS